MKARLFGNKITKILQGSTLKRGVATLEILIAFAILTLSLSAVILVVFGNQTVATDTQTNNEAIYKAKEYIESARARAYQDFNAVVSVGHTQDDIYQKSLTVEQIHTDIKKVTSTVSWPSQGRILSVVLTTLISNPTSQNKCSTSVSGDWSAPQIYGYADFAGSAGATGVDAQDGKAYVTSDPNSAGSDDFYILDTSGAGPGAGSLPVLGKFSTSYGLTDVSMAGMYAYVTAHSASNQLLVIDVSDPVSLKAASIKAKRDVTRGGDTAYGNTLFYANKKIYVGLTISAGTELHIFDVSDPINPVELGPGYEVGASVNDIIVKNNIAYLATAARNEIITLDVSDPAHLVLMGTYQSPTLTGQSLALSSNNFLYFGRIGGIGNPKLLAFGQEDLSVPRWTMHMSAQSGVYSMLLRSGLLFITTADPNDGLQIWDVSHASARVQPVRFDSAPLNVQQAAPAGTDCYGNLLYVAQRSQRALQIIGPGDSPGN
jgi:hypothetical protein